MIDLSYFRGKKILITGHTGFKGSWLSHILINAGADVAGYSLYPQSSQNLFELISLSNRMKSYIGDISDHCLLSKVFDEFNPEIVIHLAAQPIVRESYRDPVYTYQTNIMGTVLVLECIRKSKNDVSFLNVTTDKVYKNREWVWGYRENEELCGYDPYSNSKSCSELVTYSYYNSFFKNRNIALSTARAGNVIGGGDFSVDRIIPDCFRAANLGKNIIIRNPDSVRPYQHVLESLLAYLTIIIGQSADKRKSGNYNIGPDESDCISTGELAALFCELWQKYTNQKIGWQSSDNDGPHEAGLLKLDCSKLKETFKWRPVWDIKKAVEKTVEWYSAYLENKDIGLLMDEQLMEYIEDSKR